ncbi:hypothetical protein PoB_004064300 [Plakobranchus ocellatus]|uniref:Uncharacterized protein n=1 Tax=Plakobranchus ocellatus TaxID=259542 RepID=A0AAV4B3J0_9GAST|nr:hypothetical protein PoB_004064300 [Plakobranchus ocellatus]
MSSRSSSTTSHQQQYQHQHQHSIVEAATALVVALTIAEAVAAIATVLASSVHTGLVSQPLYLRRYHLPGTKKEGTSSEATPAAPAPHPSPACRDFTVNLVGGLSGYSTLPKGLPQASGEKEAP